LSTLCNARECTTQSSLRPPVRLLNSETSPQLLALCAALVSTSSPATHRPDPTSYCTCLPTMPKILIIWYVPSMPEGDGHDAGTVFSPPGRLSASVGPDDNLSRRILCWRNPSPEEEDLPLSAQWWASRQRNLSQTGSTGQEAVGQLGPMTGWRAGWSSRCVSMAHH
jgi:hypothetical protein